MKSEHGDPREMKGFMGWYARSITALGRQETWEDSPEGYPQSEPYQWWRWHDAYETTGGCGHCAGGRP